MSSHLDGLGIFGGIVFVFVIALVIYPVSFRLPLSTSRAIRRIGQKLRLLESIRQQQKKHDNVNTQGTTASSTSATSHENIELNALPRSSNSNNNNSAKDGLEKAIRVRIGLSSAPLLGVLLLLITTAIGGEQIKRGIAGADGVRPYDVLVLFISLAYIATALDATGGLRYLAFKVALRAQSGYQLYFYLYVFFFLSGAIIGNDPIVLSGTPFLAYLTRVSGITPPTAWTFAQFLAANLSSAILVSSNPTNVLIAGAFNLNFLSDFTKYTVTPSVAAAVVVYPILFFAFRSSKVKDRLHPTADGQLLPRKFIKPDVDPRSALVDPQGAIFHATLLLTTLAVLVGTSFAHGVHVWAVTLAGGGVGLIRDLLYDLKYAGSSASSAKKTKLQANEHKVQANGTPAKSNGPENPDNVVNGKTVAPSDGDASRMTPPLLVHQRTSLPLLWKKFSARCPSLSTTLARLPWPLLPFAVGMFILVQSLEHFGYIGIFAGWAAKACTSPAATVYFVGAIVAFGLCPLCGTNIGATILAVQVLNHEEFLTASHVQQDPRILKAGLFAVAIASNTGAMTSLPSSLAGLLWRRILSEKGIRVSQRGFSLIYLVPGLVVTFVALSIVLVEVLYWQ